MHPLLTTKLTNATIKRAVKDYNNGPRAKREVIKLFGKIENWDVSNDVTNMNALFSARKHVECDQNAETVRTTGSIYRTPHLFY